MKVFVIYGTECNENTAWIPWLKNELLKNSIECLVPQLPTPQNQNYKTWCDVLNRYNISKDDIIVAWSTGAIFSVRYLYEHNIHVNKLILISGFNNYIGNVHYVDEINKTFFMKDESMATKIADEIICFKSDDDPFISQIALNSFAKNLGAKIVNISKGGHFNSKAGYDEFKELYNEII